MDNEVKRKPENDASPKKNIYKEIEIIQKEQKIWS
jgi:hypothetical protein